MKKIRLFGMVLFVCIMCAGCGGEQEKIVGEKIDSLLQLKGNSYGMLQQRWNKFLEADSLSLECDSVSLFSQADKSVLEIPREIRDSMLRLSDRFVENNDLDSARLCIDLANDICSKLGDELVYDGGWIIKTVRTEWTETDRKKAISEVKNRYSELAKKYREQGDGAYEIYNKYQRQEMKEIADVSYEKAEQLENKK